MPIRHIAQRVAAALLQLMLITGCTTMDLSDFAARKPVLLPEQFFQGELQGWGFEVGPMGGIGRRIQVTATGRFDEKTQTLQLNETYRFDDGHEDQLAWTIHKHEDGRYDAEEPHLVEPGKGEAAGSAIRLVYRRAMPQTDGSTTTLSFDDWFVLIDDDTLMVRASIHKLLVPLGSMTVLYRRSVS